MTMRKLMCVILAGFMVLSLCGCSFFAADTDELLQPPALSGELAPVSKALKESAGNDYTLKYPANGSYHSPVIQYDIDGDGVLEAFALYSKTDGDTTMMYINAICNKSGKWKSVAEQKIVGGGVDRVEFCDLDEDGTEEILVGWEIYGTSEMQLAVYTLKDDILSQRMLQRYTYFSCTNLTEDDKNEIFIINFNPAEATNHAGIYRLKSDGVSEISGCALDATVKSVNEPVISVLSNGKTAVYVDEIKGAGAITEVIFVEKGELKNPLYNTEALETMLTLRASTIGIKDINEDGILEIPVQDPLPSVSNKENKENLYYTNWCSYNGETLTNQLTTIMNMNDGYYLAVPSKWVGKIAVLKNADRSLREFYSYDNATATVGEKLAYIQAVREKDWDNGKYDVIGLNEIARVSGTVFVGWLSDTAVKDGISADVIKKNFSLIEQ